MRADRASVFAGTGLVLALAAGWMVFPALLYDRREQPVPFSHRTHGGDAGMACEDCHAIGADGRFAGIPGVSKCAECHQDPIGASPAEKDLVEAYVKPGREIPWLSNARQPDNAWFSHAAHVRLGTIACARCHGSYGEADATRTVERNRLSGYGRDIWGPSMARLGLEPWQGHKMTDCDACHLERGAGMSCLTCHK